jgi:hypothetical protein
MTVSGSCSDCGAPLASDQPHCAICGKPAVAPVGQDPAAVPVVERGPQGATTRRGVPVPPQVAVVAAFLALGFGGLIGSSIGPGVDTLLAAAPTAAPAETTALADAHGGAPSQHDSGGNTGGGPSSSASASAPAPVTPAPAPAPAASPAPADPVPDDPAPEDPAPTDPGGHDPLPPDDSTLASGTVVRVNSAADSYSLASGGALSTIHAKDFPKPGSDVSVPTTPLFNGTLEEAGDRKESAGEKQATFSGTVTFVSEDDGAYVVSSPGASIPVQAAKGDMPKLASAVTVVVNIGAAPDPADQDDPPADDPSTSADDPSTSADEPAADPETCTPEKVFPEKAIDPGIVLTQDSFQVDFEELSSAGMEGIVQQVCPDLDQLVLSADDLRQSGADLTLAIPMDVDPAELEPGDSITTSVDPTPADDGTLELSGLAGDDGLKAADDKKLGQGVLAG